MLNPEEVEGIVKAAEVLTEGGSGGLATEAAHALSSPVDLKALVDSEAMPFPRPPGILHQTGDIAYDWGASRARTIGDFNQDMFDAARAGSPAEREAFIAQLGIPSGTLREQLAQASIDADRPAILSNVSHVGHGMYDALGRTSRLDALSSAINSGDTEQTGQALDKLFTPPAQYSYAARMRSFGG